MHLTVTLCFTYGEGKQKLLEGTAEGKEKQLVDFCSTFATLVFVCVFGIENGMKVDHESILYIYVSLLHIHTYMMYPVVIF